MSRQTTRTTNGSTSGDSSPKKRGRPKKADAQTFSPEEKGNPLFNLNDAEPIPDSPFASEAKPDFREIDEKIFGEKPKEEIAASAITPEMLNFERELQRMHVEQPVVEPKTEVLEAEEETPRNFLGDYTPDYMPAKTFNELENQMFMAKQVGATSIEASEDIIRHFTKPNFPPNGNFFIYKDIRVFMPGKVKGHVDTDKQNIGALLRGLPG